MLDGAAADLVRVAAVGLAVALAMAAWGDFAVTRAGGFAGFLAVAVFTEEAALAEAAAEDWRAPLEGCFAGALAGVVSGARLAACAERFGGGRDAFAGCTGDLDVALAAFAVVFLDAFCAMGAPEQCM